MSDSVLPFHTIRPADFIILLVDDTPSNLDVIREYLEGLGFELMVATDGLSCIEKVHNLRPDLILLDIQMPGINGFETCKRLKADPDIQDIPVIFLTALADTTEKVNGFYCGAIDYITKPIQYEELLARITTHLHITALTKEIQAANEDLEHRVAERTRALKQANHDIIAGLAQALQLRDHETAGHCARVCDWTVRFCRELGFNEEALEIISQGAFLHDIGKIGVPDHVLLKPGPLNAVETALMHQHPSHAYTILSAIPSLQASIDIPWMHHEKFDGNGYPRGLIGEAIPLAVRIFTIVDVWDALVSDRPYRPPMATTEIKTYLYAERGKSFDPVLFDRFIPTIEAAGFKT
jgi:putative two-component system response regulator